MLAVLVLSFLGCRNRNANDELDAGGIHFAARAGDLGKARALLDTNPALVFLTDNKYGRTALHWAVQSDHTDVAELLLSKNADVNAQDSGGRTPLDEAARLGYMDMAKLLLAHGASVNAGYKGVTPLHFAAVTNHGAMVELLLANGADVNATESVSGQTPLEMAVSEGNRDAVQSMLTLGADPISKLYLQVAVTHNHQDIAEVLLAHGADVDAKNVGGYTPLHFAASDGHKGIVELLLAHGADANARLDSGATPLKQAEENGHEEVAELLRQHGGHE
jgi:ankyrin repeat protein